MCTPSGYRVIAGFFRNKNMKAKTKDKDVTKKEFDKYKKADKKEDMRMIKAALKRIKHAK
jgi:hypothetical protein